MTTTRIHVGTLIDGTGADPVRDVVITVVDDRIAEITPAGQVSAPIDLDYSSYTLLPGLIDCHDHLLLDVGDEAAQCAEPVTWLAIVATVNARLLLRAGITTMRDLGSLGGIDVELKRAIDAGEIPGPRLFIAGQPIMRTGGHAHFLGREADGVDDMRKAVREQLKVGADQIKIMVSGGMSTAGSSPVVQELSTEEILAAIEEAHRAGRPIAGHGHGGPGIDVAVRAGIDTIEHGVMLERDQVQLIASSDTILISTESVGRAAFSDPTVPAHYREKASGSLASSAQVLKWAKEFGVTVAVGCDTAHAQMDIEMTALVEAGFSPVEAIRCLTLNGAKVVRHDHEIGSVEPGKLADLVVLADSPLESPAALRSVRAVMKAGSWVELG